MSKINLNIEQNTIEKMLQIITDENRERFYKFRFKEDSLRTLYGEIIVRYVLTTQFAIKNEEIKILRTSYGKPFIENVPLHYNISHSGEWVACAFASREVGIDIEMIKDVDMKIAERYFCEYEYDSLLSISDKDRINYFYKLWTLKESYLKWLGTGISTSLNSFGFMICDSQILFSDKERNIVPYFKQYPINNYKLSVCSGTNNFADKVNIVDIEKLF